ncbi:MAG: hypothetical protein IBX50_02800 [Marinospirillum sp.]|nr:hypothetical protein [Marinospirillum sp.]
MSHHSNTCPFTLVCWGCGVILLMSAPSIADDNLPRFSAEGYRISHYRSPTPETAEGGVRISTEQLQSLVQAQPGSLLIDVQPITWRDGIFIYTTPRQTLPGSFWLPNVGWGFTEDHWIEYFAGHLYQWTEANRGHPVVIYCTADCWMSWNAVKRAAAWGYTQLYWYREGSDGWLEAGLPLQATHPEPLSADALLTATGEIP